MNQIEQRLAKAVRALAHSATSGLHDGQIEEIIDQLALACGEWNPQGFNYEEFNAACRD